MSYCAGDQPCIEPQYLHKHTVVVLVVLTNHRQLHQLTGDRLMEVNQSDGSEWQTGRVFYQAP